jgi:hypothetical protein
MSEGRPMDSLKSKLLVACHEFRVNSLYWNHADVELFTSCSRNCPAPWISKIMELLEILEAKTIVELGTSWQPMHGECRDFFYASRHASSTGAILTTKNVCCQSGHSTYFWTKTGCHVHTIDINPKCVHALRDIYSSLEEPFPSNLTAHTEDGLSFLRRFEGTIDFLYLDGWDVGIPNGPQCHVDAFLAARDKLAPVHLVAIDDADFLPPIHGKDALIGPLLLGMGYAKIISGRQSVFLFA